jgi:Domain of unknown function (DUF222)
MTDHHSTGARAGTCSGSGDGFGWAAVRTAPADAALAALLQSRPAGGLSDAELVDALAASQRLANAAEAQVLALMGELDDRRSSGPARVTRAGRDLTSRAQVVCEVVAATWQPKGRVQALLNTTDTLRHDAPTTWAWLRAGRLGGYQARIVADALDTLVDPDLVPAVEARILSHISDTSRDTTTGEELGLVAATSTQLRSIAASAVAEAEPDQHAARHRRAFADRRLQLRGDLDTDGMGALTLHYDTLTTQTIYHRLGLVAANTHPGADTGADPRTLAQRVADLAAGLLTGRLTPIGTPTSDLEAGATPHLHTSGVGVGARVHLTMTAATLAGAADTPARVPGGGVIPAALARRIALDPTSTWYRLLTDPTGQMLDLSATGYRPTAALSRAVTAWHPTCVAPGCTRPATGCELDHDTPWPAGATTAGNLSPKCKTHHTAKTAGRLSTTKQPDGTVTWTYPSGHTHTTSPPPHPVDTWPTTWTEPDSSTQVQHALQALQRETDRNTRDRITALKQHALDQRLHTWETQPPPNDRHEHRPDHRPEQRPEHWPDQRTDDLDTYACEPNYEEYTATRPTLLAMLS